MGEEDTIFRSDPASAFSCQLVLVILQLGGLGKPQPHIKLPYQLEVKVYAFWQQNRHRRCVFAAGPDFGFSYAPCPCALSSLFFVGIGIGIYLL
jgi:hypothetical protein